MSIATFTCEANGVYGYGKVNWRAGYVYITFVNNCSQIWALYILVLFYQATKQHLQPIRPLHKFLCVKAVVFFTWWQSVRCRTQHQMSHAAFPCGVHFKHWGARTAPRCGSRASPT